MSVILFPFAGSNLVASCSLLLTAVSVAEIAHAVFITLFKAIVFASLTTNIIVAPAIVAHLTLLSKEQNQNRLLGQLWQGLAPWEAPIEAQEQWQEWPIEARQTWQGPIELPEEEITKGVSFLKDKIFKRFNEENLTKF